MWPLIKETLEPIDQEVTKSYSNQGYVVRTEEDLEWARSNVPDWKMRLIRKEICKANI